MCVVASSESVDAERRLIGGGHHCAQPQDVRDGVIEGVRIGLGGDGLFLLHRFNVVESRGKVYERDDHPMQITNYVVKNVGHSHVKPRPILALRRLECGEELFDRNPNIRRVGGEIFNCKDTKQAKVGEHNMDAGRVMHSTKPV